MPLYYSIPLFLGSLASMLFGSVLVSRALGKLGKRLLVPEQFMGFLTALAADSPEISSTVVAMLSGQKDVGVGVVFGSNLFNLAALLGVTAVIAGRIKVRRHAALLDGSVGVLITGLAVMLVLGVVAPIALAAISFLILLVYAYLLILRQDQLQRLPLPDAWKSFIVLAASDAQQHGKEIQRAGAAEEAEREVKKQKKRGEKRARGEEVSAPPKRQSTGKLTAVVFGALAIIIASSFGLVRSVTFLTSEWLPPGLLGTLVLAGLTGIPNLYTATQLALHQRGSAVLTEGMNSNSLNIFAGLMVPSLVFGSLLATSPGGYLDTGWLLGMTAIIVGMLTVNRGLSRGQGLFVIGLYLAFVGFRVCLA